MLESVVVSEEKNQGAAVDRSQSEAGEVAWVQVPEFLVYKFLWKIFKYIFCIWHMWVNWTCATWCMWFMICLIWGKGDIFSLQRANILLLDEVSGHCLTTVKILIPLLFPSSIFIENILKTNYVTTRMGENLYPCHITKHQAWKTS